MPRSAKVSQSQLAKELGVSQALVSLVLNGRRTGINAETYDRVWRHALARGYHPKGMRPAASPEHHPTQVGFVLRAPLRLDTPTVYFGNVQQGLHSTLEEAGYSTVFLGSEDDMDFERIGRLFSGGHSFQGIVILGEVAPGFLEKLRAFERRLVVVSARYPGLCHSVLGNEPQALDLLVEHLFKLGHRRIGWFGGNVGLGRHEARLAALEAALARKELKLDPRYTVRLREGDRAEGGEAVHAVLPLARRKDFPTAFIAYNSLMAAGATLAFGRGGLQVPDDLSVAGADISRAATEGNPRITAAGTAPDKLGAEAARLVLQSTGIQEESFYDLMMPAYLHEGATTGPARR